MRANTIESSANALYEGTGRVVSRRDIFKPAAAIAALWGSNRVARAGTSGIPSDVSADVDPGSLIRKLVRRTSHGATRAQIEAAEAMGYEAYLEQQLDYMSIDDSAIEARLSTNPTTYANANVLWQIPVAEVIRMFQDASVLRTVYTKRFLYEKMVEFWTDHFNIFINKWPHFLKCVDERDVIRPNSFETFRLLVLGSAFSPAMMYYLDNQLSIGGNANENYARELLELHTVGVDNGYTQQDVAELARCLTGWGVQRFGPEPGAGIFRYYPERHDNGQKVVMGQVLPPNGGIADGLTMLEFLAVHPNTAGFVAQKMARWLLGEDVSENVIARARQVFLDTGGEIKPMIRELLRPNVLHDSKPKFKRPIHLVASALRILPVTIIHTEGLRGLLNEAGNLPYWWGPPNGYPDRTDHWSGLLTPRWNFAFRLAQGTIDGIQLDASGFLSGRTTVQQVMDHLDAEFFAGEMPAFEKDAIGQYLAIAPGDPQRRAETIALTICTPSFQWF